MNKPTVTIKNDFEGMFSGLSTEEMEKVDERATVDAYKIKLLAALKKDYPGYNYEFTYGPYGGKSIIVAPEMDDEGNEDDISEYISETVARVYELGQFWTMKKKLTPGSSPGELDQERIK